MIIHKLNRNKVAIFISNDDVIEAAYDSIIF